MIEREIGDRTYIQDKPVLGQIKQLTALFKNLQIPAGATYTDIAGIIGDHISEFIAIILTQKGMKIREKDIEEEALFLDENLDIESTMEIVENFFMIVPLSSIAEKLTSIARMATKTTLTN